MGKPLTIQEADNQRLESLKGSLGVKSKVEVLRRALDSLEADLIRQQRIKRWKSAAKLVSNQSHQINQEFQKLSLLKRK